MQKGVSRLCKERTKASLPFISLASSNRYNTPNFRVINRLCLFNSFVGIIGAMKKVNRSAIL